MVDVLDKHWFFDQAWELIGPILVALIGYAVVHLFSSWRDRENKKREIRAKFLIDSYQRLTQVIVKNRWEFDDLRQVLADIQLMGTRDQIQAAEKIALEFPEVFRNNAQLDLGPLLHAFRNDLRKELSMKSIDIEFIWLKGGPTSPKK